MEVLGSYQNGNYHTWICSDGTKFRVSKDNDFKPAFAENMDIKICNRCNMACPYCHEGSTPDGKLADILNEKFIETLHPYQEVALGGGNVLEHPSLVLFLQKLRDHKVITNITLNQKHFLENLSFVKALVEQKLVYGIGVSLSSVTPTLIEAAQSIPNVVIHTIVGIVSLQDIYDLSGHGLKVLFLGYKTLRRGHDFFAQQSDSVVALSRDLASQIPKLIRSKELFDVVSFDNLALEQLAVKPLLSKEEWEQFYAGDDGSHTFYIDMVERKFAKSSTASFDKRYDLLDNVDEMFRRIQNEH